MRKREIAFHSSAWWWCYVVMYVLTVMIQVCSVCTYTHTHARRRNEENGDIKNMTHFGTFSRLRCLPAISWSLARWVSNVWSRVTSPAATRLSPFAPRGSPVLAPFQGCSVHNFWFFFPVRMCVRVCVFSRAAFFLFFFFLSTSPSIQSTLSKVFNGYW